MSDTQFGLLVCMAYGLLFFVGNIILEGRRKHRPRRYIVDGKLLVGQLAKAGVVGLVIPAILTIAGIMLTSGPCEDERGVCASFGELVFDCQLLVAGLLLLAAIFWVAKMGWRFAIRPASRVVVNTWKRIRPRIPVQW